MKKIILIMITVSVIIFNFTALYAQRMGAGRMHHGWGMETDYGSSSRMNPEQEKEWRNMRSRFWNETLESRQKLTSKQIELQTLWEAEEPDLKKTRALSDEIADLQLRLEKKYNEFIIQCREKFSDQDWSCPGEGYGYGMGRGMMYRGRDM